MFPSVVYFIHSINNVYVSIPVFQFLPPHPVSPWYPYICSLCLCLYFCFANKIIYTIFLDSTYLRYYTIFAFLFLTYFTLYDTLYVHPHLYKWPNFVPFYGWVIFHCMYVPHLFFFISFHYYYYFYLFLAVLGLSFCARAFSSWRQVGATLHRGARASHYRGLSCCGAQAPDAQAQ